MTTLKDIEYVLDQFTVFSTREQVAEAILSKFDIRPKSEGAEERANMQIITENSDSSLEEITCHLRLKEGVLQQAWNITHYRAGVPHKQTTEWRDVPQADAALSRS